MLTVCVDVKDRKLPLKVHLLYTKKQNVSRKERARLLRPQTAKARGPVHDFETYGDLVFYTS